MPCSDDLWRNAEGLSADEQILAMRIEDRQYTPVLFSDLLRILLDRREAQPIMRPAGHELCLFGLQVSIWKVSHDPDIFNRLTGDRYVRPSHSSLPEGRHDNATGSKSGQDVSVGNDSLNDMLSTASASNPLQTRLDPYSDELSRPERQMLDMRSDRDRVEIALETWHRSFQTLPSPRVTQHRDTLMSSLLLWHMSYLRLSAPLHQLHDISYRTGEAQEVNVDIAEEVHKWAQTKEASLAVGQALKICELIHNELERPPEHQASFNFLAFATLHHAAVVLWTTSQIASDRSFSEPTRNSSSIGGLHTQRDTKGLMRACARFFRAISPLGGSSFGLAADRLSAARFPSMQQQIEIT